MRNTANLLQMYMQENGLSRNEKPDAPLFYSQKHRALTTGGITHILQKYVDKALCHTPDMPSKATPHMLRHSKVVHLLQAGVNIILIRDIMGHTCVKTTEMYTKVDMETKREALEKACTD
jgi:site-specific recombinase XerD